MSENERDRGSQGRRRLRLHSECVLLAWRWRLRRYRCLGGGRTDTCWARSSGLENSKIPRDDVAQRNSSCALWVDCHVKDACVVHRVRVRSTRNKDEFAVLEAFVSDKSHTQNPHVGFGCGTVSVSVQTQTQTQSRRCHEVRSTGTGRTDSGYSYRRERRETRDERRERRRTGETGRAIGIRKGEGGRT